MYYAYTSVLPWLVLWVEKREVEANKKKGEKSKSEEWVWRGRCTSRLVDEWTDRTTIGWLARTACATPKIYPTALWYSPVLNVPSKRASCFACFDYCCWCQCRRWCCHCYCSSSTTRIGCRRGRNRPLSIRASIVRACLLLVWRIMPHLKDEQWRFDASRSMAMAMLAVAIVRLPPPFFEI